jgi:DNA repair exonuclease SbcCD ATPase subunit
MKKVAIFLISFVILSIGTVALSQTTSPRLLERIRERATISNQEFQQNRGEIQRLIERNQLEIRNQIEQKREEMQTKIEKFKEQLRERLKARINERKQAIVERVYERINNLNTRLTNHYLNVLEQLEKVLERIESRAAKAKLNGVDISKVEEAIKKAQAAIEKAKQAVIDQAKKVYAPPEISGEDTLKQEVGKLRQQFHEDIKAVEKLVKEARDAVREAAVTLGQIRGVDGFEVPSATPTPTPAL